MAAEAKDDDEITIEVAQITLNSISLKFKNTGTITCINCYHLNEEKTLMRFINAEPNWELIATHPMDGLTDHISFHFLQSSHKYKITFHNHQKVIAQHEYTCTNHDMHCNLSSDSIEMIDRIFGLSTSTYISPSMFHSTFDYQTCSVPMVLDWITNTKHNDSDWMWYVIAQHSPINDALFIKTLLLNSLFALPHGSVSQRLTKHFGAKEVEKNMRLKMIVAKYTEQVMLCPNPKERQVIDFRINKQDIKPSPRRWSSNKKLKRYKDNFYLSVNYRFKEHLQLCKQYHIEKEMQKHQDKQQNNEQKEDKEDGTWITNHFIDVLDRLRQSEKSTDVLHFITFELWERDTNEIVAASFAYLVGSVLCDYTFMTLKRDNRSCGTILTKVIGHILESCSYDLWYWGFRLAYMTEYDKYGGKEMPRAEFADVLKHSCRQQPKVVNHNNESVLDIIQFIKHGNALIAPLPEWMDDDGVNESQ